VRGRDAITINSLCLAADWLILSRRKVWQWNGPVAIGVVKHGARGYPKGVDVEVLAVTDVSQATVTAWRDLCHRAVEPNPFFHPELVLAAAECLDGRGCYVLTVSDNERLLACLPVRSPTRWGPAPFPMARTWKHQYCFLGTPLVDRDPSVGPAALRRLMTGLGRCPGRPRAALLEMVNMDGPLESWMRPLMTVAGGSAVIYGSRTRGILHRSMCEERDVRLVRRLLRLRRRLEREIGAPLQLVDRSDAAGVEAFLQLEAAGWKGRQGSALASNPNHAQLLRRWCATLEKEGRLQVLFLQAGDLPLAAQVNLLDGDGLFGFKVAYDERFARRSPGVLLELEARELWCANGQGSFVDSCAGEDNRLVNRVFPGRRTLVTLLLPLGGLVSSAAVATAPRVRNYLHRWRSPRGKARAALIDGTGPSTETTGR
jgi:CelD/BcsL family acetyltransferase involved in cellulose biosynthesis